MAAIRCGLSMFSNFLSQSANTSLCGLQQVRNKYVNRWMTRDLKRRHLVKEHAVMRLRLKTLKKNDVLPPEIKELAGIQLHALPRQSALNQLTNRCILTSRPRGNVRRWRVSRLVFRSLADYNKLSGVIRAIW